MEKGNGSGVALASPWIEGAQKEVGAALKQQGDGMTLLVMTGWRAGSDLGRTGVGMHKWVLVPLTAGLEPF
jgi:hypothetical protein